MQYKEYKANRTWDYSEDIKKKTTKPKQGTYQWNNNQTFKAIRLKSLFPDTSLWRLIRLYCRLSRRTGSLLDTCESPSNISDESGQTTIGGGSDGSDGGIPYELYPIIGLANEGDTERFDICMELLERGELSTAKRIAECHRKSIEITHKTEDCGAKNYVPVTCDNRLCPWCMSKKKGRLKKKWIGQVAQWENKSHLVLTVSDVWDLEKGIEKIKNDFAKFRCRKIKPNGESGDSSYNWTEWKSKLMQVGKRDLAKYFETKFVKQGRWIPLFSTHNDSLEIRQKGLIDSGFYGIDVKEKKDGSYNIHIHCLIDACYIPVEALSNVWGSVTGYDVDALEKNDWDNYEGTGNIVWINRADKDAYMEVIGYASKEPQFQTVEKQVDYMLINKGSAMVHPIGGLYGASARVIPDFECKECGGKHNLVRTDSGIIDLIPDTKYLPKELIHGFK